MKTLPAVTVSYEVTVTLTEAEARALDGILGYDENDFLKVFYEKLGKAYLQQHEAGFRSLCGSFRSSVRNQLAQVDNLRRVQAATE